MDSLDSPRTSQEAAIDSMAEGSDDAESPPLAPEHRRRLSRTWRIVRNIALGIIAAIFLAWLILYITKGRFLKHPFERTAASLTHRQVKVAGDFQLYFDPFTIKFLAEGMTIANPDWASKPNLFEAKRIDTRIATFPLIFGTRRVNWLDMLNGSLDLEADKAGKPNTWTFSDGKGKPFKLPITHQASVAGTTMRYIDPRLMLAVDLDFQTIRAADTRFASAIRFSGKGHARGNPFTVTGALLTPNVTVGGGSNRLDLHANAARTAIDISGTLRGPTELEGADLHVATRGRNIADLFSIAGIAVPATRAYRLTPALTQTGNEYRFTGLEGRVGDSDIAGKLTVANVEPRLKLTATLATRRLDIVDAAPIIGYDPDTIAAWGTKGAIKLVGGTPRILPDATLRIESLRNFD